MKNKKGQEEFIMGLVIGLVFVGIICVLFLYDSPKDISYRSTYNLSNGEIISCDYKSSYNCGYKFDRCYDKNNSLIKNTIYKCQINFKIIKDCSDGCKINLVEVDENNNIIKREDKRK